MSRRKLKENESSSSLVLSEYNGPICSGNKYLLNTSSNIPTTVEKVENANNKAYFSFKNLFKSVFLPEGYPNSVSEDYVAYQIWDTVQAFCSSISGTLAARAMFETIGVGDDQATVYGAVLTWLIKDGTGMVGRIIFAWHKGSSLDANSKMWRLYADILNDLSFLVDLTTPFFPRVHSIYFVSCSSLLRSLVGVAGGATRSALTQHQALQNNLADVSAKDSSQETLVNLVALIFNLVLFVYLKDSKLLIWPLFFIFVCGHLFANYCAVKSIVMKTFNRNRFHILSGIYLKSGEISGPKKVNNGEPVLSTVRRWFSKIDLGAHINTIQSDVLTSTNLGKLNEHHYLIDFNLKNNSVSVLFEPNINLLDQIKCLLQIEIVEYAIQNNDDAKFKKLNDAIQDDDPNRIESESFSIVNKSFDDFVSRCKSEGW